jgi:DNA-binding GntR family transcriptional regulator
MTQKKSRTKLTDSQKETIAVSFLHGATQTDLAELYGVSRRTIQTALQDKDMLPPDGMHDDLVRRKPVITKDEKEMLELLRAKGVNTQRLHLILTAPVLIKDNVIAYMAALNDRDTVSLLTAVRAKREGMRLVHAS